MAEKKTRFKEGDYVKIIKEYWQRGVLGRNATIVKVDDGHTLLPYCVKTDCGRYCWLSEDGVEPVELFTDASIVEEWLNG